MGAASALVQQSNQPSVSVLSKPSFIQQTQKIVKQENLQPPSIDDLSHLA